jgi:SAM-dependent methyltransferase
MLGILAMITTTKAINAANSFEEPNISHTERNTLPEAIESIANKIKQRGDLAYISVASQLELLQALSQFELGRFLLQRGGLNGYFTNYIIKHPKQGRLTGLNSENQPFTQLELFLLNQAPSCLATQQRFEIFKKEIQNQLHDGITLASIPCGLTADLLDLDFSQTPHFSIHGIDIDPESLIKSQQIAENLSIADHCQFVQRDAWALDYEKKFDVITSNGLSIYEPDNTKIVALYHQFFLALKPNGCLITSFLTPPPIPGTKTEWDLKNVNTEHALLQKIVFADVLECKWQIFRSEELVRSQLLDAGFTEIDFVYDQAHIFPTVIARKV